MLREGEADPVAAPARPVLWLVIATVALLAIQSPWQSIMPHDEGWYAQQARVILLTGDWVTQHWWGALGYDRVMGIQWLIAASFSLFGVGEFAARLPVMLSAFGCVLLTYQIARRCVGEGRAFWAALILAVMPGFMQAARLATQDIPLVFLELLGVWALLRAEENPAARLRWGLLAGGTIGLAFMMKGFMVLPAAAALAPYLIFEHRRHRHLANPGLYLGLLIGFIPFTVWMGLSVARYGWLPLEVMFGKLFFLAGKDFHGVGPLYYLWNVPALTFPWGLLAVAGMAMALRSTGFPRRWLWIGYPVLLFVELSAFTTRTWYYPLQIYPFLAIVASVALCWLAAGITARRGMTASAILAALGAVLILAGLAVLLGLIEIDGVDPVWPLGVLGLLAGAAWLSPLAIALRGRTTNSAHPRAWMAGWLLGPAAAIAVLAAAGLWGDYSRAIKRPLRTEKIAAAIADTQVHFVAPSDDPGLTSETAVALAFYTPVLGDIHADPAAIPDGALAWVHAGQAVSRRFAVIGEVGEWRLVRFAPG